jgi:hypothetical protein
VAENPEVQSSRERDVTSKEEPDALGPRDDRAPGLGRMHLDADDRARGDSLVVVDVDDLERQQVGVVTSLEGAGGALDRHARRHDHAAPFGRHASFDSA